jgi:hypothetical protein
VTLLRRVLSKLIRSVSTVVLLQRTTTTGDRSTNGPTLPELVAMLCRLLQFAHRRTASLTASALHVLVSGLLRMSSGGEDQKMQLQLNALVAACTSLVLVRTEADDADDDNEAGNCGIGVPEPSQRHCIAILFEVFCSTLNAVATDSEAAQSLASLLHSQVFGTDRGSSTGKPSNATVHLIVSTLLAISGAFISGAEKGNDRTTSTLTVADEQLWSVLCSLVVDTLRGTHENAAGDTIAIDILAWLSVANALRCAASTATTPSPPSSGSHASTLTRIATSTFPKLMTVSTDLRASIGTALQLLKHRAPHSSFTIIDGPLCVSWTATADAAAFCAVLNKVGGAVDTTVSKYLPLTLGFHREKAARTLREVLSASKCIAMKETYVVVADAAALRFIASTSERRNAFAAMLAKYDATCGGRLVIPFQELHDLSHSGSCADEEEENGRREAVTWLGSLARTGCTWLLLLPMSTCTTFVTSLVPVAADGVHAPIVASAALEVSFTLKQIMGHAKVLFVCGSEGARIAAAEQLYQKPVVLAAELMSKLLVAAK